MYQACDMFEKFQIAVHIIRKQPVVMLPLLLELTGSQGGARMPAFHFAFPGRRGWDLAKLPKSTVKTPCWVHSACFWPAAGRTYTNLDEAICYFHGRTCYRSDYEIASVASVCEQSKSLTPLWPQVKH